MLQSLSKIVGKPGTAGSAIPLTGDIITASAAFKDAGLSLKDAKKVTGMSFKADYLFVSAIAGESACSRQAIYIICIGRQIAFAIAKNYLGGGRMLGNLALSNVKHER